MATGYYPTSGYKMTEIREDISERWRSTKEVSKAITNIIRLGKKHGIRKRSEAIRFAVITCANLLESDK